MYVKTVKIVKIANVVKDAANMAVRFVLDNGDNLINNTEFPYLVYFSVYKDDLLWDICMQL